MLPLLTSSAAGLPLASAGAGSSVSARQTLRRMLRMRFFMKTAWLLLPAFTAGLAAVVLIVRGIAAAEVKSPLFPDGWVLWGGIAVYAVLLAVTLLVFHRPVTTELFLIVGWAMLTLSEISTLYGTGRFSRGSAMGFTAVTAAAALVSLVCYVLYYNLKGTAGYYDGAVPLAAAAVVMAGLCAAMVTGYDHLLFLFGVIFFLYKMREDRKSVV